MEPQRRLEEAFERATAPIDFGDEAVDGIAEDTPEDKFNDTLDNNKESTDA